MEAIDSGTPFRHTGTMLHAERFRFRSGPVDSDVQSLGQPDSF